MIALTSITLRRSEKALSGKVICKQLITALKKYRSIRECLSIEYSLMASMGEMIMHKS